MELQVHILLVQGKRVHFLAFSRHSQIFAGKKKTKSCALVSCMFWYSLAFVQWQKLRKDQPATSLEKIEKKKSNAKGKAWFSQATQALAQA